MNKDAFKKMPIIETERLLIRPFLQSDFYDYANWHNSGEIRYCFNGLYDITSDNEQSFIKFFLHRVPKMFKSKLSGIWCISEKTSNKNIGLIEFASMMLMSILPKFIMQLQKIIVVKDMQQKRLNVC